MIEENIFYKNGQKFMILDTETEGLNLNSSRPFQLSWIICDKNRILEKFDKYIYWDDLSVSPEACKITKFDKSLYKKKALSPSEVYSEFSKYLYDPSVIPVCQNFLNFDCYMIKNLQKFSGNKIDFSYLEKSIDTKVLFIALQKNLQYPQDIPFLNWQFKINSIVEKGLKSSQLFMLNYFDIDFEKDKLHEAMYDITMLYEIFKKLLIKIDVPNLTL